MALGIFETLDWLKKQDKRLCCRIDQVYDELSAELATKITNQQGTPSFRSDTLANLPAPGQTGRMFISTDTFAFYRDNGIGWDLIGGPGIGTVTGSGTATQVAFWNGTSVISGSSNLYWDNVANRLGIGTSTPSYQLDIVGGARFDISGQTSNLWLTGDNFYDVTSNSNAFRRIRLTNTNNGISSAIGSLFINDVNSQLLFFIASSTHSSWANKAVFRGSGTVATTINSTNGYIEFRLNGSPGTEAARFATTSGNLLVNTTTDAGFKLDVNGTTRISGAELRLDNGTTGTINLYSATPSIQFFSGDPTGYRLYRSSTSMALSSAGAISLQIGGNNGYILDATNGHIWRNPNSGGAALARLDTGGSLSIGNGTNAANASSILDLTSTTKGFLPPRMTQAQRTAIASPAVGLIVYQTDATEGLYVNTSTGWRSITMV